MKYWLMKENRNFSPYDVKSDLTGKTLGKAWEKLCKN